VGLIAPFAPGAVFVTNTGPAPDGNLHEAIRQVVTHHGELADIAADHGVRIALEPLNPVLLNAETAIWTYGQALDVVQQVDRENVGVCLDLWNLWQDPDLVPRLADAPDRLFLLQVSDWRTPRSRMDRRGVGTGDIPVGQLLRAAYNVGYRGPCVLEIFCDNVPDSLYETDLDDLLRTNRTALESAGEPAERGRERACARAMTTSAPRRRSSSVRPRQRRAGAGCAALSPCARTAGVASPPGWTDFDWTGHGAGQQPSESAQGPSTVTAPLEGPRVVQVSCRSWPVPVPCRAGSRPCAA
jgi:hypothetical protein